MEIINLVIKVNGKEAVMMYFKALPQRALRESVKTLSTTSPDEKFNQTSVKIL
jgi:hypothetical protein